ncbi:hypothetical protein LY08_02692 [Olleya aquimaris]|uniref:PH domain-containing protein n=1 Tax=Olleya aquimaris TaxID=639310 RepID=A0A327R724_9FLAO|nr:hypothetical protein LY08_02692 [Olleya aquimaris]
MIFDNLKVIGFIVILLPFYYKWRNGTEFVYEEIWIWLLAGFILITNIPAILIYLNYYLENKNTEFTLDYNEEKILITQNGIQKEYSKHDITKSTYHLGIYYKNAIDRGGRIPMLISDFGYWDLQFKNGDRYYLTNILHDFLLEIPKVPKTKYRFRFYPYISKNDNKQTIDLNEKPKKEKSLTETFIEKFKTKNEKQLLEILDNRKSYQEEAVKAAEILMRNKNVG